MLVWFLITLDNILSQTTDASAQIVCLNKTTTPTTPTTFSKPVTSPLNGRTLVDK